MMRGTLSERCGKGENTAASILQTLEEGGEVMVGVKIEDENGVVRNVHYSVPIDQHTTLAEVRRETRRRDGEEGLRGEETRREEKGRRRDEKRREENREVCDCTFFPP